MRTQNPNSSDELITFTENQKIMLLMSEEDDKHGRLISQKKLDEKDLHWLNEPDNDCK